MNEFLVDYESVVAIMHTPAVRSFSQKRLSVLEARFELHRSLNGERELSDLKKIAHRDFYNVRKVHFARVRHSVATYGQLLLFYDQSMREKAWRSRKRGG